MRLSRGMSRRVMMSKGWVNWEGPAYFDLLKLGNGFHLFNGPDGGFLFSIRFGTCGIARRISACFTVYIMISSIRVRRIALINKNFSFTIEFHHYK